MEVSSGRGLSSGDTQAGVSKTRLVVHPRVRKLYFNLRIEGLIQ